MTSTETGSSAHSYKINSAVLKPSSSSEQAFSFDIRANIVDFEVFEHLDKPYTTGIVSFVDNNDVFPTIKFEGSEEFEIEVQSLDEQAEPISKTFVVDRVVDTAKNNERTELVTLHLIEKHAFISSFSNISRAYSGTIENIIRVILGAHFDVGKLSLTAESPAQQPIQVIIPNLTPLQAAMWLRDRATSTHGFPFYLFSTFVNDRIHFQSLENMLSQQPVDGLREYVYSQAFSQMADASFIDSKFVIQRYVANNTSNLSAMIDKGLIGASHLFHNSTTNETTNVDFNIKDNLERTQTLLEVDAGQNEAIYRGEYLHRGQNLHQIKSRVLANVSPSYTFDDYNSYGEARTVGEYNLISYANSLRHLLTRDPIDISVPGANFIDGRYENTIGNKIALKFLTSDVSVNQPSEEDFYDKVRSGNYLIYAARHIFKKERYDVTLSCVKLSNLDD